MGIKVTKPIPVPPVPVGTWYKKIKENINEIDNCLDYFDQQYEKSAQYVKMERLLIYNCETIGIITQHIFAHLQEIETILEYFKIKQDAIISKYFQKYNEHYQKDLSHSDIKNYINGEDDIIMVKEIINGISFIRSKFQSIMKGLEFNHFQLTNITKLKEAGMEDSCLSYIDYNG